MKLPLHTQKPPIDLSLNQARVQWGELVIADLPTDIEVDVNNLVSFTAWEMAEGGGFGNQAVNNPLNTTLTLPGSWNVSYTGGVNWVQGYPSEAEGVTATVDTLLNGSYPGILASLAASADPYDTASAIGNSPWGTLGYVIAECIPDAAAAVAAYYVPPPPPPPQEENMFIRNPATGECALVGGIFIRDPASQECGIMAGGVSVNLAAQWPTVEDAYGDRFVIVERQGIFAEFPAGKIPLANLGASWPAVQAAYGPDLVVIDDASLFPLFAT